MVPVTLTLPPLGDNRRWNNYAGTLSMSMSMDDSANRTVSDDASEGSWLAMVDRLLDEGVDRSEAIELTAEELDVDIPTQFSMEAPRANWRFNGTVRVTIDGNRAPLAAWLKLWDSRLDTEQAETN